MGVYHTVIQGEHLSRIAHQYGFTDYRRIWDAPENAGLRSTRTNPNVLMPGDRVFIPDRESKTLSAATDRRHRFLLDRRPLVLRLRLAHEYERPMANRACSLQLGFDRVPLTTDGSGQLETGIEKTEETASLTVHEDLDAGGQTLPVDLGIGLRIGHLDPVEERSGQVARLRNLAYYPEPEGEIDEKLFRAAVEEFQCENALAVDGVCGAATQAKLKQVYGC